MKIRMLEVQNFRGFARRSFTFSDHFNVLIGDNGAGKTAALDALALGINAVFVHFDQVSPQRLHADDVRRVQYELGQTLTMEPQYPVLLRCVGQLGDVQTTWERIFPAANVTPTSPAAQDNHAPPIAPLEHEQPNSNSTQVQPAAFRALSRGLQAAVRQGQEVLLPLIAYYGTRRHWNQPNSTLPLTPDSRTAGYLHCLDPTASGTQLFQWLKTQEMTALQEQRPIYVLEAVKAALVACVEEWQAVAYNLRADDVLATRADGSTLPLRMLSDGYRTMLGMVADMAYRAAVLNPHLGADVVQQTPGVVLIDELDLHLHPTWQRQVVEDLKRTFPHIQFIATTHSPFIIQSLKEGELINLDTRPTAPYADKSIEDIAERVMGVDIPQRSERYQQMMATARAYYQVLHTASTASAEEIAQLKRQLDDLSAPFSDNVAYHAFLEMEREAAGLGNETYAPR